jgi:hypothetical protein
MNELSVAYLFITFMIKSSSSIQFISQTKQYFEQQDNIKFILEFRLSIIFLDWSYHNLGHLLSYFQTENSSYFIAARHKLNAFFSLVFRFSSCHHPLLASALAKIMEDRSNQVAISKEDNDVRQVISMISNDNHHVVL